MDFERQNLLKENFRRSLHSLADAAADIADELFKALSRSEMTQEINHAPENQKQILTKKEVADLLQVSVRSINNRMNEGLPFSGIGRNVRFNRDDVFDWIKSQNIKTGSQKSRNYDNVISLTVHDRRRKTK